MWLIFINESAHIFRSVFIFLKIWKRPAIKQQCIIILASVKLSTPKSIWMNINSMMVKRENWKSIRTQNGNKSQKTHWTKRQLVNHMGHKNNFAGVYVIWMCLISAEFLTCRFVDAKLMSAQYKRTDHFKINGNKFEIRIWKSEKPSA